jgi:hypothetical protein
MAKDIQLARRIRGDVDRCNMWGRWAALLIIRLEKILTHCRSFEQELFKTQELI